MTEKSQKEVKNLQFIQDFFKPLNALNRLKTKPYCDKPVPLRSILHDHPFTKQCLDEETFGIHDFLTRFDAEEVEWFLNKPIDDNKGNTCVHEAVLKQCTDKLVTILKHGGSPNVKGFAGKTPVHCACELVSKEEKCRVILELLLRHGGDLYQRDDSGVTPINLLQWKNVTHYTIIVQDFCSSNAEDLKSFNELHRIIQQQGPLEEFKQLYSHAKCSPRCDDSSYHTLLFRACKEGWSDGVNFMLSAMKEIPTTNHLMKETPLHAACEGNHYEIVVKLITKFPELLLVQDCLTHRRWHPIHSACAFGASDEILEVLLVGILCLMTKGHEMMPSTLVHMSFIDALGRTPLYIATKCGNLSHLHLMMTPFLFEPLMQSAPTLYAIPSTEPWPSPIHCAITHGREESLVNLLNALPFNNTFAYPSFFALRHMLQHILKGTDAKPINFVQLETTICESSDGELHLIDISSALNNYEVLRNCKVLSNLTLSPLAMASAMGNANITEILLDKGAKDDDGLALRLSLFLQHHDIARMILSFDDSQICLGNMKKLFTFLLPNSILDSFTTIYLEDNCLNSIPLALFQLPKLKYLNVSNNNLVQLPVSNGFQSGWSCINIKSINISGNKLDILPAVIWNMPELQELHAANNSIREIESATEPCVKLKIINISQNKLFTVPQHIFLAEEVNISYNNLKYLPECTWKSKILCNLNVSNNQVEEIRFPNCPCNSRVTSFTSSGKRRLASDKSHSTYVNLLSALDLSSNNLTSFPKYLTCFAYDLQKLNISNNPIHILYICLLPPYLKFMSANGCSLGSIEIDDEENLCNHKTHTSLKNLTSLNLKENRLKWFQFSFKISNVDPNNNSLIYPKLGSLDLSNNLLCGQLDSNVGNQRCLVHLNLRGNRDLKSLPLELCHLSDTLSQLQLDDIPNMTDSYLKEYQSHQFPANLQKLLSHMKSVMKSTVQYRMINLVIVGAAESGKTSLMKRLSRRNSSRDELQICIWKFFSTTSGVDMYFRTWDFPSQENHVAGYYHLYVQQAIYLVVFKLTGGANAIKALDRHLRNIKTHAPGCPVMIIGTHLDAVNVNDHLIQHIRSMYSDIKSFPKIADVCWISNTEGRMRSLRNKIYSVSVRLQYGRRNQLILGDIHEADAKKLLKDPSAVLQQYIPQSYLNLQKEIDKKVLDLKKHNLAPMMNKDTFFQYFYNHLALFEDEEDMVSAVKFLHSQSKLFHFESQFLDEFYFIDLQWIFTTMTNITKITNSNGIVSNDELIAQSTLTISKHLQAGFLALLARFNFAIAWKDHHALVHTLLPKELTFSTQSLTSSLSSSSLENNTIAYDQDTEDIDQVPKLPKSQLKEFPKLKVVKGQEFDSSDVCFSHQILSRNVLSLKAKDPHLVLHRNLHRVWLASFIPDGFWPQLLTKIISDDNISSLLSDFLNIPKNKSTCSSRPISDVTSLWKLCQKGLLIHYEQTKLLELKEVSNEIISFAKELNLSKNYAGQLELTVYTDQIATLHNAYQKRSKENVNRLASKFLVAVEQNILDIGEEWFPDTFHDPWSREILLYIPCPVGLSQNDNGCVLHSDASTHQFLHFGGRDVFCFSMRDLLDAYPTQSRSISCPTHKKLLVQQIAPDICFGDLDNVVCSPDIPLIINEESTLGSGGSAIVLRGKMVKEKQQMPVAVKIINDGIKTAKNVTDFFNNYTTTVEEYRLIRREVNFISALCHPHLTQLSGVRTHPFMLLIELAPLGSLSAILEKYKRANDVLTPTVLQASVYQVASAVDFLHQKYILHCDLKSSNVLVWEFPLPGQQNSDQQILLKITDYGASRVYNVTNQIRYGSIAGTPGFIAPEVYTRVCKNLQSNKIDVFAFGMFMYELISLLKPFELLSESPEALLCKQRRPEIPKENFTPCLFQRIMRACWNQNPNDRPNMAQVVEWSQFPELKSLRTIHQLEPRKLLEICQCQVVREHVHQYATVKPQNVQSIIPNCDHFKSFFSSLSSQTPRSKRKQSTSNNHTQIWIAQDKDEVTTKLTIFTFRSSDLGCYTHEDTTTAKVVAMTSVGHYMWVYINDQNLHVIQTAKMKTITCVALTNSLLEVLQLLHVPEWHMVLVLWELSEIWCIHDEIGPSGLYKIGTLLLNVHNPISSLCTVTYDNTTEVWATRKDKEIVILTQSPSGCCENDVLVCTAAAHRCHLITCLHFNTVDEKSLTHVWVSFDGSSQLVCWDGPNKTQLHTISLYHEEEGGHCTSLLGHEYHLYVGTSLGKIAVFDSISGNLLQQLSWHSSKVDALMELPPEIKQSICTECKTREKKVIHHSLIDFDPIKLSRKVSEQPSFQSNSYSTTSRLRASSLPTQPLFQNYPLIVSLGDNLAEHLNMGIQNSEQRVELLTWTGYPTAN